MSVEEKVIGAVAKLANCDPTGAAMLDKRLVGDLGLGSLDIAELVATLEAEVGCDPFALGASISDLRTVGDLVGLYVKHAPPTP